MWKQKSGSNATYKNLINVFERAGHQDYADKVKQMLASEVISSGIVDGTSSTTAHSPKQLPELKREFPSLESTKVTASTTTTTTVIIEKEHQQGIHHYPARMCKG